MIEIIPNWHPIFVHFTIALISISALLFVIAKLATNWRLEDQWLATAYWNLWIGALISIITVAAGWYAYNTVIHDTPSHAMMTEHRNWALVTFAGILTMAGWGLIQYRKQKKPAYSFVIAMVAVFALVLTTAWHGGEIVYRFGLGVMNLPKPDTHHHAPGTPDHHDGQPSTENSHDSLTTDDHHDNLDGGDSHAHDNAITPTPGSPESVPSKDAVPPSAHDEQPHDH